MLDFGLKFCYNNNVRRGRNPEGKKTLKKV
jgi:hypothetical protein